MNRYMQESQAWDAKYGRTPMGPTGGNANPTNPYQPYQPEYASYAQPPQSGQGMTGGVRLNSPFRSKFNFEKNPENYPDFITPPGYQPPGQQQLPTYYPPTPALGSGGGAPSYSPPSGGAGVYRPYQYR